MWPGAPEQLDEEFASFLEMTREVYEDFGFEDVEVALETRPEKFLGELELWERAEKALADGLTAASLPLGCDPELPAAASGSPAAAPRAPGPSDFFRLI